MFKRFLVSCLAVTMLTAQLPMNVHATEQEVIAVAEQPTVTEEMSEQEVSEPVVEEPAVETAKMNYTVTCTAQKNFILAELEIRGYETINDYYSDSYSYTAKIVGAESTETLRFGSATAETVDGETVIYLKAGFWGNANTNYTITVTQSSMQESTVLDTKEITTGDEADISYTVQTEVIGNILNISCDVTDYMDEFAFGQTGQYYMLITNTENPQNSMQVDLEFEEKEIDGETILHEEYQYFGEGNTTYDIKVMSKVEDLTSMTGWATTERATARVTTDDAFVYHLSVEEPDSNIISGQFEIEGYENYNQWNLANSFDGDSIYYILNIRNSETFEYETQYIYPQGSSVNNVYKFTVRFSFVGEENTTYDVTVSRQKGMGGLPGSSHPLATAQVTTKEAQGYEASLEIADVGAGYADFTVKTNGADKELINRCLYIQYGTDSSFANANTTGIYTSNGAYEQKIPTTINYYLAPETKYYARIIYRENYSDPVEVVSNVVEFTTQANETYSESLIPDQVLLEKIKANVSSFDKVGFEKLNYLYMDREAGGASVQDLTGLEYFPNLKSLSINYHAVSDLSPVAELKKLTSLSARENGITTIPNMSGLTGLTSLDLNGNKIPSGEFTLNNGNIPEKFRTVQWLGDTRSTQKMSEDVEFTIADTYYMSGDTYPIQVELGNLNGLNDYTMSIYEGEELLAEKVASTGRWTSPPMAYWLFEGLITESGNHTLTFVAYVDDTEVGRTTKTIYFDEEEVCIEISNGHRYANPDETYLYMYFQMYNEAAAVSSIVLQDQTGEVSIELAKGSMNTSTYDDRYSNVLRSAQMKTTRQSINTNSKQLTKYLKVGSYDLVITLEDGRVLTEENALTVTENAILSSMNVDSNYSQPADKEYLHIGVNCSRVDWDKVYPVVYEEDGNAVTEVAEYKITGTESAIYKLKKISEAGWASNMTVKLQNNTGAVIENLDEFGTLYLNSSNGVYYVEYDWQKEELLVMCDDLHDGQQYTWELRSGYGTSTELLATAKSTVKNGLAMLNFVTTAGEKYVFKNNQWNYVFVHDGTSYVNNGDSFYLQNNSNARVWTTISNYSSSYVNNGEAFSTGYQLAKEALSEDSVLTVALVDASGNKVADGAAGLTKYEDYWYVKIGFENLEVTSDTIYYAELKDGNTSLGKAKFAVLSPDKNYYSGSSFSWNSLTQQLSLDCSGAWLEELEQEKIQLTLNDLDGNEIVSVSPSSMEEVSENRMQFVFDLAEQWESLTTEYPTLKWTLSYDDEEIPYAYLSNGNRTIYMSSSLQPSTAYLYTEYRYVDGYRVATRKGISGGAANANMKVYIYEPYDAEAVACVEATLDESGKYDFTSADLRGLKFNDKLKLYDLVLVDANGQCVTYATKVYLGAEIVAIENPFGDVKDSDWYYPYVMFAYENNLMGGKGNMPDGSLKFDAANTITRAEFVQMLYSKEEKPAVAYADTFKDVPDGTWYTDAILWAAENEIVGGKKADYFDVSGKITRQEIALILYKYALYNGYDVSEAEDTDLSGFADANTVSNWASTGMKWAVEYGVIGGKTTPEGMALSPGGNAIRAEAATMVKGFMSKYE